MPLEKELMKKSALILVCSLNFIAIFAAAHGEDKEGPHGGFIRMPGAFHTELVSDGKNKLKIYLLDIQWKNPSIKKSEVLVNLNDKLNAKCEAQKKYFLCSFPKSVDLTKKGLLKVTAVREEQKGMEVSYPLPLKLEVIDDGHGDHH